jgi:hypothetical protein
MADELEQFVTLLPLAAAECLRQRRKPVMPKSNGAQVELSLRRLTAQHFMACFRFTVEEIDLLVVALRVPAMQSPSDCVAPPFLALCVMLHRFSWGHRLQDETLLFNR